MSKPIIEVNNLSKKYTLGERQPYYSFRDTISSIFRAPLRRERLEKDEFWALKDVSFDINQGDVVGVIGRNGAGKSTLLKILSQITLPTEGEVKLRGRVASLLEVGTGFHPELTGRENIYLNGAILGMKRWEINKKFKEIVEFSEIEKFLDTPVKHYSSGMYMRLAFAVAAHLEPEILLVDEVLAVGDAQFQKKCLGKMSEVSKQGRTVLFVSHNLGAISELCNKTILLKEGFVEKFGSTKEIMNQYTIDEKKEKNNMPSFKKRKFFKGLEINNGEKIITGKPVSIKLTYHSDKQGALNNSRISIAFKTIFGSPLFICSTEMTFAKQLDISTEGILLCKIDKFPLNHGSYQVDLFSEINGEVQDWLENFTTIEVSTGKFFHGIRDLPIGLEGTEVLVPHSWELVKVQN